MTGIIGAVLVAATLSLGAPAQAADGTARAGGSVTSSVVYPGPTSVKIRNVNSGRCLADQVGVALVDSSVCYRTSWYVDEIQVGAYWVRATSDYTQCLVMNSTANEARPDIAACGASNFNDHWVKFWNADHTQFQLQNAYSSKCLVGRDSQTYAVQYDCGSWTDQLWTQSTF